MVHTQAVVGEISDDTVVLTSDTLELFRMPLALLPQPLVVGMVVDLHTSTNPSLHTEREQSVREIQHALCARLRLPAPGGAAASADLPHEVALDAVEGRRRLDSFRAAQMPDPQPVFPPSLAGSVSDESSVLGR